MSQETRHTRIEGAIGELLIDLAFDYCTIPRLALPPLTGGVWEHFTLAGYEGRLNVDGSILRLRKSDHREHPNRRIVNARIAIVNAEIGASGSADEKE